MVTKEERRKMAWELALACFTSGADLSMGTIWLLVDRFLEAETAGKKAEGPNVVGIAIDEAGFIPEGDTIEAVKARIAAVQARDGGVSEAAVRVGYNRTVER